ncbi:hypothetical protein ATCV1_z367R [Acanthocystis turfacea chlorella virus 1]|uniref:Uncharacterized protein z367R n=1 Tax=Chlorovirus heliozoae TaxID=322019 RepID=A7K8X7_9PHYC|nr:hypothetical protein ATCV1_z367R [Acanthocystis turfacea chlorella virus 1]ABT16501.1 hypothetical protein ATCV1_z367R [Acanthocystis turfacea chlorella virus 1]
MEQYVYFFSNATLAAFYRHEYKYQIFYILISKDVNYIHTRVCSKCGPHDGQDKVHWPEWGDQNAADPTAKYFQARRPGNCCRKVHTAL